MLLKGVKLTVKYNWGVSTALCNGHWVVFAKRMRPTVPSNHKNFNGKLGGILLNHADYVRNHQIAGRTRRQPFKSQVERKEQVSRAGTIIVGYNGVSG